MRLLVMFDLPVETSENRRNYRRFRKALINEGFLMIQFSVYVRVCVNRTSAKFMVNRISDFAPESGLIQTLIITEAEYNQMEFLVGKPINDVRNISDRTVII